MGVRYGSEQMVCKTFEFLYRRKAAKKCVAHKTASFLEL